jgi:flagellar biosynthetic protein FliP
MEPKDTGPGETTIPTAMSHAAGHAGTDAANTGDEARRWLRLGAGWHFTRHLLEMVVAMIAGMAVLGAALAVLGEPPGYANLFVEYGLMGASMAAPMVAWMRYRGHSYYDGGEMTAAMVVPMLAPVALVELGVAVPGLSEGSLMVLSHVAMIAGMIALMAYRFDRYAHGSHGRA